MLFTYMFSYVLLYANNKFGYSSILENKISNIH